MNKKDLKQLLLQIKEDDYKVPKNVNPFELALTMMQYIGDVDPVLRDILILSILYKWSLEGVFTKEELYKIFEISIDKEHLHYGMGQINDTVFTRTFSVEIVAICIYLHRKDNFLEKKDVKKALDKVIEYMNKDKDVRGYIEHKGWAHGAAHGADTLDELARCQELEECDLQRILECISKKIQINYYCYIHQEDERLVTATLGVLERKNISEEKTINWLKSFVEFNKVGEYPTDMIIEVNVKNFLRSLYFRLLDKSEFENIINEIIKVLNEMNKFK